MMEPKLFTFVGLGRKEREKDWKGHGSLYPLQGHTPKT
jgi:hypothetical protein